MNTDKPKLWYSIQEACTALQIDANTIYTQMNQFQIAGSFLVPGEEGTQMISKGDFETIKASLPKQ